MIIRDISQADKDAFNQKAGHPLQAYEWGQFRELTGVKVIRKGIFEGKKLITPMQVTIHPLPAQAGLPKINLNIGYFPKGPMPDETQLKVLRQIGEENRCLFIKLEPNVPRASASEAIDKFLFDRGCKKGRPMFTKYTFELNLKESEETLLKNMHPKTRYNINLAQRKGVKVVADNSQKSFKWFIKLLFEETVKRQGFYSHTPDYFAKMWQVLKPTGMAQILRAEYQGKILATFMVFVFNNKIYYPYGASTREDKELMAPNLVMWETIRLGKKLNCQSLDMWGALGPKPNPKDPWYGFHRFKQGYGTNLIEFLGSYDLVLRPKAYGLYRIAEELRWLGLRLKAKIR
ncbi:MAG: peptidoglycan bridge formation glycyltransferase FemA/FemB family protein [Candidatus Beckwithbacteria bacterium]|nr:peptidoglycan bridge formation glycyltransferase FemA/FemB family protein [Candidatus Beckwithbacteria bacterium]